MGTVPEARLNLVIFHMHNNEVQEAYELMKEIEPTSPQEYILKGVTNLALGQQMDSREHLKVNSLPTTCTTHYPLPTTRGLAQQYFQLLIHSPLPTPTTLGSATVLPASHPLPTPHTHYSR